MTSVTRSPFFNPKTPRPVVVQVQTPGGTRRQTTRQPHKIEEHKSTRLGCTCNLVNAIVGSGIVGIPYALKQAGFMAGIFLIVLCAILTDKSLRLLLATAKHAKVPSYETVAEAAFGKWGFGFISGSMLVMAYGAMLSYLMIVKDTFSVVFGVAVDNFFMKRAMLLVISLLIIVPLSAQRDMADLAKTSRISVVIDILLVLVVTYKSPLDMDRLKTLVDDSEFWQNDFWIHTDTIFVGLGVLSFAFVCQHSAFIIAGSLDNPTLARWSTVTLAALGLCATLALLCGTAGYLGFLDDTSGNVLNNLPVDDALSNAARAMLGTTMLLVYPMESFVARHVLVVLLFEGRRAHEGDDASILARRDRRIGLTVALYISAVLPALLFENLGHVLAATGAVGGSCLSYIGPGAIYLGIHGDEFRAMIRNGTWWRHFLPSNNSNNNNQTTPYNADSETATLMAPVEGAGASANSGANSNDTDDAYHNSFCARVFQTISWYILFMPLWSWIAKFGETSLTKHRNDMALKSPHPLRIGDVAPGTPKPVRQMSTNSNSSWTDEQLALQGIENVARANSFSGGEQYRAGVVSSLRSGDIAGMLGESSSGGGLVQSYQAKSINQKPKGGGGATSLNQQIGNKLVSMQAAKKTTATTDSSHQQQAIEKDPQRKPSTAWDFLLAIFFIIFGVVAMVAGLVSMFLESEDES